MAIGALVHSIPPKYAKKYLFKPKNFVEDYKGIDLKDLGALEKNVENQIWKIYQQSINKPSNRIKPWIIESEVVIYTWKQVKGFAKTIARLIYSLRDKPLIEIAKGLCPLGSELKFRTEIPIESKDKIRMIKAFGRYDWIRYDPYTGKIIVWDFKTQKETPNDLDIAQLIIYGLAVKSITKIDSIPSVFCLDKDSINLVSFVLDEEKVQRIKNLILKMEKWFLEEEKPPGPESIEQCEQCFAFESCTSIFGIWPEHHPKVLKEDLLDEEEEVVVEVEIDEVLEVEDTVDTEFETNLLYIGKLIEGDVQKINGTKNQAYYLDADELIHHMVVIGPTGSGKTVLCKSIIEMAVLHSIPSIIVDPKGDLSSLILSFPNLTPEEFLPWIETRSGEDPIKKAEKEAKRYTDKLNEFNLSKKYIRTYRDSVECRIFTPRSLQGIPLSISSIPPAPPAFSELSNKRFDEALQIVDSAASTFVKLLFPGKKDLSVEKTFLEEIIAFAWKNNVTLSGINGLKNLIPLIESPPFERIGAMVLEDFFPRKKRLKLIREINSKILGSERLWTMGEPLEIENLIKKKDPKKTAISIINLCAIERYEEKSFFIAQLAHSLYRWMIKQGGSAGKLRLLFYIDEVGGGGGKEAFLPRHPYMPSSKSPLTLIIKQARAFGLGCLFATQNPGDIDYKALANFGTWAIGCLKMERDRKYVLDGLRSAEIPIQDVTNEIIQLKPGEFVIRKHSGDIDKIKERWLLTYHRTLTLDDVSKLKQKFSDN